MQEIGSAGDVPVDNKNTPLLPVAGREFRTRSWLALRYGTTRKCVSNKAALLMLLWSFVVGLLNAMLLNPDLYVHVGITAISFMIYGVVIVFTWFFAGMLADIRFGRYKTVVNSLFIVLIAVIFNYRSCSN